MLNNSTPAAILPMQCYVQPFWGHSDLEIYNESNLHTMGRMPDNCIDLTVTSPPYDGLRNYNGYSFPFEEIAKELYRVTKQGGVVVWVVNDSTKNGSESLTSFRQALFRFASNRCSFVADHRKCSGRRPSMTNRTRRETSSRKPLQRVSCEEVYRTIVVKRGAYAVRKKLISSPSCAH